MKNIRLIILLENSITLSRYNFNFSILYKDIKIILLYPKQDQEAIRVYINYFFKSYPIDHGYDVIDFVENKFDKFNFKYSSLARRVKLIIKKYDKKDIIILSSYEFYTLALAKLRDQLSIQGIREKDLLPYRDKALMFQYLYKTVRLPKTILFDLKNSKSNPKISFNQSIENLGIPFVIKQARGSGSMGVYKIGSFSDYSQVLTKLKKNIVYIMQEFISSDLYHMDIGIKNSKIFFSTVCQYTNNLFSSGNVIVGSIPVIDSRTNEIFFKESQAIIKILGYQDGFFHFEFFYNGCGRPIFLECGNRPGGGYISHMYEIMYGFNIYDFNVTLAVSDNIDKYKNLFNKIYQLAFGAYIFSSKELSMNLFEIKSYFSIKKQEYFYECLLWNKNVKNLLKDIKLFKNLIKSKPA